MFATKKNLSHLIKHVLISSRPKGDVETISSENNSVTGPLEQGAVTLHSQNWDELICSRFDHVTVIRTKITCILLETNSSHLKIDGNGRKWPIFSGVYLYTTRFFVSGVPDTFVPRCHSNTWPPNWHRSESRPASAARWPLRNPPKPFGSFRTEETVQILQDFPNRGLEPSKSLQNLPWDFTLKLKSLKPSRLRNPPIPLKPTANPSKNYLRNFPVLPEPSITWLKPSQYLRNLAPEAIKL